MQVDGGNTSAQFCSNSGNNLVTDLVIDPSNPSRPLNLLTLVRYKFEFVIVAQFDGRFADGPPSDTLTFTSPASGTYPTLFYPVVPSSYT